MQKSAHSRDHCNATLISDRPHDFHQEFCNRATDLVLFIDTAQHTFLSRKEGDKKKVATSDAVEAATHISSPYRMKFSGERFLELVEIAKTKIIYQRRRMHFFAYDGFVMYSFECQNMDFA